MVGGLIFTGNGYFCPASKSLNPSQFATQSMSKKKSTEKKPKVHDELQGFDIKINSLGEVVSNFHVERLNAFLNEKVEDKKLKEREDEEE